MFQSETSSSSPSYRASHALDDDPRLFYMHFWANDDALKLARGLRAAVDLTNSKAP